MMTDWEVSSYRDPNYGQTWVYYENPNFPDIHFSRSVDEPNRAHMATNDGLYYYFGAGRTFNRNDVPGTIQGQLQAAWRDYYTVK